MFKIGDRVRIIMVGNGILKSQRGLCGTVMSVSDVDCDILDAELEIVLDTSIMIDGDDTCMLFSHKELELMAGE